MGNLFGKITTDAGPLEDEINCDCSRSPTQVYNGAQRGARRPTTNNVYIDSQHRSRSQSKVYSSIKLVSFIYIKFLLIIRNMLWDLFIFCEIWRQNFNVKYYTQVIESGLSNIFLCFIFMDYMILGTDRIFKVIWDRFTFIFTCVYNRHACKMIGDYYYCYQQSTDA